MAFQTDNAKLWMVSTLATPVTGSLGDVDQWTLIHDEVTPADVGYDTHLFKYRGISLGTSRDIVAQWPQGSAAPAGDDMYVQTVTPRRICGPVWEVDVLCRGLVDPDKIVVNLRTSLEEQVVQGAEIGSVIYANAAVKTRLTGIEIAGYLDPGDYTDKIGTTYVPTAIFPSVTLPAIFFNDWEYMLFYTYHYPNGWVLDDIVPEPLWSTSDERWCVLTWSYVYDKTPA